MPIRRTASISYVTNSSVLAEQIPASSGSPNVKNCNSLTWTHHRTAFRHTAEIFEPFSGPSAERSQLAIDWPTTPPCEHYGVIATGRRCVQSSFFLIYDVTVTCRLASASAHQSLDL